MIKIQACQTQITPDLVLFNVGQQLNVSLIPRREMTKMFTPSIHSSPDYVLTISVAVGIDGSRCVILQRDCGSRTCLFLIRCYELLVPFCLLREGRAPADRIIVIAIELSRYCDTLLNPSFGEI